MNRLQQTNERVSGRPHLRLAAVDGRRLPAAHDVPPIDGPERPLEVEFVGLTPAEQLRALAFPGGRRFVLKTVAGD